MAYLDKTITAIQAGNLTEFEKLLTQFEPLIYSWLKKNKKLHTAEQEDYYSLAKTILLECALNYEADKHVPFPSYYKIKLWHKTGNIIHKKKYQYISLEALGDTSNLDDFTTDYEYKEQLRQLQLARQQLTKQENDLLDKILMGYEAKEIAALYHLKKKTILNRKYLLVKKLKQIINGR